ncbi:MAG: glucose-1-phosphate adenylyltransferase subunit GlgD [Eubacteriales bacterium]|nr:glucose-1-phosphate adenylyltransferase subunit GlgD [Eubacteriales bacterium]
MLSADSKAMGIIFPNSFDSLVSKMVELRLMASLPFASRYRMVDFVLSSMSNCGIDNVAILPSKNYRSLMEHLGTGREWDLARKNGGVHIFPPFAENRGQIANGRIVAINNILRYLRAQNAKYVVMCDSNLAVNFDFKAMIQAHIDSGADVSIAYNEQALPESFLNSDDVNKDYYYSFDITEGRISEINVNPTEGVHNLSMNIFVLERELLIKLVKDAFDHGLIHFTRDILWAKRNELNLYAYKYEEYVARICSINSYFDENMKLLDRENLDALFGAAPIFTKIRDDNPTRYLKGTKVNNVMAADGCVIEGEVENSILFRGVKVARDAKVKNCVLMQDTVVEAGANIEYLITDKEVVVSKGKEMKGTDTYPTYIVKGYKI